MPSCQAINCGNVKGQVKGKSFFQIPDPTKSKANKALCKKWLDNLRNPKLKINTFKFSASKVVCEDHFPKDSFRTGFTSEAAKLVNFLPKRKDIHDNAVPTLIDTGRRPFVCEKIRVSTQTLQKKRRFAQIKEELRTLRQCLKQSENQGFFETVSTDLHVDPVPSPDPSPTRISTGQSVLDVLHNTPIPEQTTAEEFSLVQDSPAVREEIILQCGHPCITCMERYNLSSQGFTNDHSYFKTPKPNPTVLNEPPVFSPQIQCSTPLKRKTLIGKNLTFSNAKEQVLNTSIHEIEDMNTEDDLVNLSTVSNSFRDDSKDLTFVNDSDPDSDSDIEEENEKCNIVKQKKYLCFEDSLMELFVRLRCPECDSPVDPDDITKDDSDGTLLRCSIYCTGGHLVHRWSSQPILGKMPAGNLLMCAAILFCGQTYTHISQMTDFFNMKFLSHAAFHSIQRQYVMPVIMHNWSSLQDALLRNLKGCGKMLRLAGDGRCDSPGFSAKYCTYSMLEMDSDTIVTFVVVQVSETGSSSRMEAEGFRRCMNYLLDLGFTIQVLATDRHVQIRSIMGKEYPNTSHQFDVWHLSNNIKKKLMQKAKAKGCEDLGLWIKAICNHLWWCSSNCNGNKDWLEECWKSVVPHTVNEHHFHGEHITQCPHEPLDPEVARKKKWLKRGSKAHNALLEVVLDKRLTKDIRQLSEFCHTGSLEVYHSLMTKYVPKRQEFDFDQMNARTALAVIDHNMSRDRIQMTNKKGEKMFKLVCTKANAQWVVKPRYERKTYDWVSAMMVRVVKEKKERTISPLKVTKMRNIAPTPAPPKSELIASLASRFLKS